MAATGKTPILLYGSTTATNQPSAGNLTNSSDGCEIAINVADKNLFFKDATNTVNTVPIRQSSASSNGWLSSTDWSTFNSKQPAGTYVTSVTGTAPVVSSGGTTPAISMAAASGSVNGYLTSTDWTTFNNKAPAFTYTSTYIPYGQGTTTPTQSANFVYDGTNLGLGTSSPSVASGLGLSIYGGAGQARIKLANSNTGNASTDGFQLVVAADSTAYIEQRENAPLAITTNNAEMMRLFASGGVSIGNQTDPGAGSLNVNASALIGNASNYGVSAASGSVFTKKYVVWAADNTGSASNRNWNAGVNEYAAGSWQLTSSSANNNWPNDAYRFAVTIAGSCYNTTGTYGTLSDERFKDNVETARSYLEDLMKLRVVKYSLKEEKSVVATKLGLIAQEVEQVFPNMVEIGSTPEGNEFKSIKMSVLIPMLLSAVQELTSEIATLKGANNVAN